VNVTEVLDAYQLLSPAFCAVIEQVPEDFCAVTVSPRVPDRTQSLLLVVYVMAPVPLPPEAVSAVETPKGMFAPEKVGPVPTPLFTTMLKKVKLLIGPKESEIVNT
jgi:hypothetical protein